MATAADLQSRLDAIRKARDSGVLNVRHGDESTQFRSLDEMDKIIKSLQKEIDGLNGVKKSRVNYIEQRTQGYDYPGRIGRDWH